MPPRRGEGTPPYDHPIKGGNFTQTESKGNTTSCA